MKRPRIIGWMVVTVLALGIGLGIGATQLTAAEEDVPEGLVNLQELIRLIEIARESGFTEEEIEDITIEDHGRVIKALEYYNQILAQRARKQKEIEERLSRVYFTVEDIIKELVALEPGDLKKLREDLVVTK